MMHTIQDPIPGKSLAQIIGLKEGPSGKEGADMRSIINSLRIAGLPICANDRGYFWPRVKQELSDYIKQLKSRIEKQQEAVDGLRKGFSKIGISWAEIKKEEEEESQMEFSKQVL